MAGYGTDIEAPTWSDGLIKTLLRAAQVRAQRLETLEMHYRKRSEVDQITTWDMWIDGSGWMIAAWSQQLERELPIVAEGYANLPKARSVRIARSLVTRWHDLVVRRWIADQRDEGLSGSRITQARQVLRASLEVARLDGLIGQNPVVGTKAPRAQRREHPT